MHRPCWRPNKSWRAELPNWASASALQQNAAGKRGRAQHEVAAAWRADPCSPRQSGGAGCRLGAHTAQAPRSGNCWTVFLWPSTAQQAQCPPIASRFATHPSLTLHRPNDTASLLESRLQLARPHRQKPGAFGPAPKAPGGGVDQLFSGGCRGRQRRSPSPRPRSGCRGRRRCR